MIILRWVSNEGGRLLREEKVANSRTAAYAVQHEKLYEILGGHLELYGTRAEAYRDA
jgi:hypothetical protein